MQTIRLKVDDKVYNYLMKFLKQFKNNEIEIIKESKEYISNKAYLEAELLKLEEEQVTFLSKDQLEKKLERAIKPDEA